MSGEDDLAIVERIRRKLGKARATASAEEPADPRTVLRQRARALATKPPPPDEGESLEVIEFRLGRERLAFESSCVREVFVARSIVKVPCAPPFIAGIVNLRGSILSVVDLSRLLDLPPEDEEMKIVLHLADEEMEFGALVAEVNAARRVFHHDIQPPLYGAGAEGGRLQRGILPGAVSLLDARNLLASPQLRVDQRNNAP